MDDIIFPSNNIEIDDVAEKITVNNQDNSNNLNTNNIKRLEWNSEREVDYAWGMLFWDVPSIYSYGNKIFFHGEIHKESINKIKEEIIKIGKELHAFSYTMGQQLYIELYIHSPGGGVGAGFNLIDFIETFPIDIYTIGTGEVASMAFLILLSGKKKYLTPNSHILIHDIRAFIGGKRSEIIDYIKHIEDLYKQIFNYILKKTKLNKSQIEEFLSRETWISASKALDLGIVDDLWTKEKRG